ncbi:signal transducer and activator of transcription (STAT) family protein [Tieghemostelium lacteum]|uniref:Signal transducer and activator of transcription (STAT) family protein n=1 Tax=Tieghemostelium lacteum TaxID=361077 RepID=A0A152A353_TIELA|nr:signal transducer and activator of transcription (STAT) family protein [Tieghemostelium lacteum]|eukprot:KYR00634.1 signal transducer and activator of transcription (STAT) family protein [Tieghemostelium lacteum]
MTDSNIQKTNEYNNNDLKNDYTKLNNFNLDSSRINANSNTHINTQNTNNNDNNSAKDINRGYVNQQQCQQEEYMYMNENKTIESPEIGEFCYLVEKIHVDDKNDDYNMPYIC